MPVGSNSDQPLRIVFFGAPDLAAIILQKVATRWPVAAAITQLDKPQGRDLKLTAPAVKRVALELGIPVLQPPKARQQDFLDQVRAISPDLIVVAAYGQILPQTLLDIPRYGCLNVHTSLLPRWRGAAPIQWAIAAGDSITGVTIMKMDAGLDTGEILSMRETEITDRDTGTTLHDRLALIGGELLIETIPPYIDGRLKPRPQPDGATYARKITKEDGLLDWNQPASDLWRRTRAFTPWPGAFTFEPNGSRLKVHEVEPIDCASGSVGEVVTAHADELLIRCSIGCLKLLTVQREGGKRITAREYLAGQRIQPGQFFKSTK